MLAIAFDGGTTNTRASLLDGAVVLARATRPIGARDVAVGRSNEGVAAALAACAQEVLTAAGRSAADVDLWCGSGMLTSNVGVVDLPHVLAPTSEEDLARAAVDVPIASLGGRSVRFLRGVRFPATADRPFGEMMRGEECETFGLLEVHAADGPTTCVLSGSHVKVVEVAEGRIVVAARTSLVGEMIQALAEHTILAASVPKPLPDSFDEADLLAGADAARERGLASAAFMVRAAQVLAGRGPRACAGLLVGAAVGADVDALTRSGGLGAASRILTGGSDPLKSTYVLLLRRALAGSGRIVESVDERIARSASALGAVRLASRG